MAANRAEAAASNVLGSNPSLLYNQQGEQRLAQGHRLSKGNERGGNTVVTGVGYATERGVNERPMETYSTYDAMTSANSRPNTSGSTYRTGKSRGGAARSRPRPTEEWGEVKVTRARSRSPPRVVRWEQSLQGAAKGDPNWGNLRVGETWNEPADKSARCVSMTKGNAVVSTYASDYNAEKTWAGRKKTKSVAGKPTHGLYAL